MKKILVLTIALSLAFVGMAQASSFTLIGDYLKVGISDSGALVTDGGNVNTATGIQLDTSNTGTFPPAGPGLAPDFVAPANTHEFFSIGVNNSYVTNGYYGDSANYTYHNPMNTTTVNASAGTVLRADTTGNFSVEGAQLRLDQSVYFDKKSSTINFSVDILNLGNTTINNVVYARGLDPDQPAYPSNLSVFATNNSYPRAGVVQALDTEVTGWMIQIIDNSGTGKVQIMPALGVSWSIDPYAILNESNSNTGLFDNSINIAFDIGTLEGNSSVKLDFQYYVAPVPIPGSLLLLGSGLLSLVGLRRFRKG